MRKHPFPFWALLSIYHFCHLTPTVAQGTAGTEKKKRPNILLILADDVGTGDIGSVYWKNDSNTNSSASSSWKSPPPMHNLEQLASDSVVFTDAHSTPLCATSRYLLLSGNYNHRGTLSTGVWNFGMDESQFIENQKSIADVLREEAGYHTAMMGKWHLGGKMPRKNPELNVDIDVNHLLTSKELDWTQPFVGGPQDIGFDSSFISMAGIQAPPYTFYQDGILSSDLNDILSYEGDSKYDREKGTSKIILAGEGDVDLIKAPIVIDNVSKNST